MRQAKKVSDKKVSKKTQKVTGKHYLDNPLEYDLYDFLSKSRNLEDPIIQAVNDIDNDNIKGYNYYSIGDNLFDMLKDQPKEVKENKKKYNEAVLDGGVYKINLIPEEEEEKGEEIYFPKHKKIYKFLKSYNPDTEDKKVSVHKNYTSYVKANDNQRNKYLRNLDELTDPREYDYVFGKKTQGVKIKEPIHNLLGKRKVTDKSFNKILELNNIYQDPLGYAEGLTHVSKKNVAQFKTHEKKKPETVVAPRRTSTRTKKQTEKYSPVKSSQRNQKTVNLETYLKSILPSKKK